MHIAGNVHKNDFENRRIFKNRVKNRKVRFLTLRNFFRVAKNCASLVTGATVIATENTLTAKVFGQKTLARKGIFSDPSWVVRDRRVRSSGLAGSCPPHGGPDPGRALSLRVFSKISFHEILEHKNFLRNFYKNCKKLQFLQFYRILRILIDYQNPVYTLLRNVYPTLGARALLTGFSV